MNIEEELLIGAELSRMRCEVCNSIETCTCFCKCGLTHDCCVCGWKEEDFKNV